MRARIKVGILLAISLLLIGCDFDSLRSFNGEKDSPIKNEMIFIKAGCYKNSLAFVMESSLAGKEDVCVEDFYINKYEITSGEWNQVMTKKIDYGNRFPANRVTLDEINQYIKMINKNSNYKYRLPTSAEWEFACRAGENGRYEIPQKEELTKFAWTEANSKSKLHKVGALNPNELGLYDMIGNVQEVVSDTTPLDDHITRGGAVLHFSSLSNCIVRGDEIYGDEKSWIIGFRLASDG